MPSNTKLFGRLSEKLKNLCADRDINSFYTIIVDEMNPFIEEKVNYSNFIYFNKFLIFI